MTSVDLRSDTVTRPTPAMRQAMAQAAVGDDVFGEDPTVNALEARAAELFGREAALFVPSGTMANQIALRLHTRHGDEVIAGYGAHSYLYETGASAALAGVQITPVGRPDGLYTADDARLEIKPPSHHSLTTTLLMFENTHNRGGGRVFPLSDLEALVALAKERGLRTHLDGARIFNACVATGLDPEVYGRLVDTLCFCLSKGLGAPVGSMLVGDRDAMDRARRFRKMYGGGMRQVGILAAAGYHALEHHRARLIDDHVNARRMADGLRRLRGVALDPEPETNIVFFTVNHPRFDAAGLVRALEVRGIRVLTMGHRIRAVLHLDVSAAQVDHALGVLEELLGLA
jgi:threonine aldolase